MKKIFFIMLFIAFLGFSTLANANLVDNGGGFIYDTDLNITWYDTTSFGGGTWDEAMEWVAGLNVGGVSGWRLPTTPGGTFPEYLGEMGHLYYDELKNVLGGPLTNTGPFANLMACDYWTGTEYDLNLAWDFYFHYGGGGATIKTNIERALAVHSGNIKATPAPAIFWLLSSGLICLAGLRRKLNK